MFKSTPLKENWVPWPILKAGRRHYETTNKSASARPWLDQQLFNEKVCACPGLPKSPSSVPLPKSFLGWLDRKCSVVTDQLVALLMKWMDTAMFSLEWYSFMTSHSVLLAAQWPHRMCSPIWEYSSKVSVCLHVLNACWYTLVCLRKPCTRSFRYALGERRG